MSTTLSLHLEFNKTLIFSFFLLLIISCTICHGQYVLESTDAELQLQKENEDDPRNDELDHPATQPEECLPMEMAKCTDPLKIVTDNKDLGFAATASEMSTTCPKLMEGLRCIDDFTNKCLDNEHKNYFNILYQGTTRVILDLCHPGSYQQDYLKHAPCMKTVQSEYERCAENYQSRIEYLNKKSASTTGTSTSVFSNETLSDVKEFKSVRSRLIQKLKREEEENVRILCCSFHQYMRCSSSQVNETCGNESAQFAIHFLDRMSGPLIQGHCSSYADETGICDQLITNQNSGTTTKNQREQFFTPFDNRRIDSDYYEYNEDESPRGRSHLGVPTSRGVETSVISFSASFFTTLIASSFSTAYIIFFR